MGQCSLSEIESNYLGDLFNTQCSEQSSFLSDKGSVDRQRVLWQHELKMTNCADIPKKYFWNEQIYYNHPCFQQISKDVTRTFPELSFFGNKSNLDKFQKILRKFALYFPKVGYTQGLNFLAGFLMISGCEQEESFNVLTKLMVHDRILAIGLYEDGFPLNKFYCQLFWILLQRKLPKIYDKLKRANIPDQIWIFQWFISLFLYNFPIDFVKRLWDFTICKKQFAPVLISLGILRTLRNQILNLQIHDQIDFLQFTQQFRDSQFCRQNLDLKKIFGFANTISKLDIDKAIASTTCYDNPYRIYFSSSLPAQRDQWIGILQRFENERCALYFNPQPQKYQRAGDVIEHLQKIVLSKYKLYQSDLRKPSGSIYKRSTFSIPFSIRTCKTNTNNWDFNKKRFM